MQLDIISFNTGRHYSEQGQRIAAAKHNGVVIMVDIDRGIDYAFPGIQLDRKSIMQAYDYDQGTYVNSGYFNNDALFKNEFMTQLRDHAISFPGCLLPNKG